MPAEIDLAASEGALQPPGAPHPELYDPSRDRERIRGAVAMLLIGLLFAVIFALLLGLAIGSLPLDGLEKVAAVILAPVISLVGPVLGFYYGEQSRRR